MLDPFRASGGRSSGRPTRRHRGFVSLERLEGRCLLSTLAVPAMASVAATRLGQAAETMPIDGNSALDVRAGHGTGGTTHQAGHVGHQRHPHQHVSSPHPMATVSALRRYLEQAIRKHHGAMPARGGMLASGSGVAGSTPAPAGTGSAPVHSQTNVQVQGVDEADIVKTDGNDLYILSRQQLLIVNARPADALAVESRTTLEGYPVAMYLDGTRLTVVSQVYPDTGAVADGGAVVVPL